MRKETTRYLWVGGVVLLGVLAIVGWGIHQAREQEARRHAGRLRDPVFLQTQTQALHPQVMAKLQTLVPDAVISDAGASKTSGMLGCKVQLPLDKANQIGKVIASIMEVNREYRRQGYNGIFELYVGDHMVKHIP